jgi:hypothetical protein
LFGLLIWITLKGLIMSEKKVIFHIDDEPEMLRLVKMILGKHG